jgi:hypothetical protein
MSRCVGDRLVCKFVSIQTCTPDGHLHTVTYNRRRMIQLILLMMSIWVLETCSELKCTHTKKILCIKLVNYKNDSVVIIVSYVWYMRCTIAQRLFAIFSAQRQSWYTICERQSDTVGDCHANISIFLWQLLSHKCTPYCRITRGWYNTAIWGCSTKGPFSSHSYN